MVMVMLSPLNVDSGDDNGDEQYLNDDPGQGVDDDDADYQ